MGNGSWKRPVLLASTVSPNAWRLKMPGGFSASAEPTVYNADFPYNLQEVVMSETMLALVALMVVVFFAFSQQRAIVRAEQEIASVELEVLATAIGSEMMQLIATRDFDDATIGVDLQTVTLGDLTVPAQFGNTLSCPAVCDDIDDFNNMKPDTSFFEIGRDEFDNPIGFSFEVTADVRYVNAAGVESTTPTWTKEVTLYVDQALSGAEKKYLLQPIQLKRQFSPQ